MTFFRSNWRWVVGMAIAGMVAVSFVRADDEGEGEEGKPDQPEKKEVGDVRNAIGDLSQVRAKRRAGAATQPGLWEKLVNQPYYTPEVRAQKLLFFGQYKEAEGAFAALLKTNPDKQDFLEGEMEAILRQGHAGDVARFLSKVETLTDGQRSTAKMLRLRAEAMVAQGWEEEAISLLKGFIDKQGALAAEDGEVLAVFNMYAQLLEGRADYLGALAVYTQVAALGVGKLPEDSGAATEVVFAMHRESVLNASGKEKHSTVLNLLAEIEDRDGTYWPAKLVEARVLLESHNAKDGGDALNEVLDLNPNETRARFLAVDYAIESYNFELARTQLDEIKKRSDGAQVDACEGRLLLKERLPDQAIAPLLTAIKKDRNLPQAHGWLAGAYYLTNNEGGMKVELAAMKGPDGAEHPVALYSAGEILRDARQFSAAEGLYVRAIAAAKWWSEPEAALAQLYLETGQEEKAKAAYDKCFEIDPYNLRAYNQLKLLEYLKGFASLPSRSRLSANSEEPAFVIRYAESDEVLAHLAVDWMEKVRPEIWSYFEIQTLPATTQIELFPSHEEFGVRTTGLPWIGTVGACTGNVIAMDVPRGGAADLMGNFDWARVMRHEYTHTVTLAMTNNRIPHWLTEAAACNQEDAPRDWENCQLLASNYRAGTLFKIADLNWGFIRPKRSIDRQLAYMQSQWIYEYLVQTYGLPKMIDFMHCFRDGLGESQAWVKAYGKTMGEMDGEFLAWAGEQIKEWGLPADPLPNRAELEAAVKKDPKDVESLVKLAWLKAGSGDVPGARKDLETAISLNPGHLRGRELLGALLSQSKKMEEHERAREMLEALVAQDEHRPVAIRTLGLLAMERRDFDSAVKWFSMLELERPLEETSYVNLAGIYLLRKENDKAVAQLLELERHEQKDERIPRKLSQLLMAQGKLAEAEGSAYRAIRIDPYNAINHEVMGQVLMAENDPGRAVSFWKDATDLQPKVAEFWEGLAGAQAAAGDVSAASEAAKKAVELEPDSAARKYLVN